MNELKNKYFHILSRLDENINEVDIQAANANLDILFEMKPIRLKWFLVKSKLMLREGKSVNEVISFLEDKCSPIYEYENVGEYFEVLSMLYGMTGDEVEESRIQCQYQQMRGFFGNHLKEESLLCEVKIKLGKLRKEILNINNQLISKEQMIQLAEYYYMTNNFYLYMLWIAVINEVFEGEDIKLRDFVIQKTNTRYYYENIISKEKKLFAVIESPDVDIEDCNLTFKALQMLNHDTIFLRYPMLWDKSDKIEDATKESINQVGAEKVFTTYYIEKNDEIIDNQGDLLDYSSRVYTEDEHIMVLGSGMAVLDISVQDKWKTRMECLTKIEYDYWQSTFQVGKFCDYLTYIAKIYGKSKNEIKEMLYKKPECRFSIIIPCRNGAYTLYDTVRTCLSQTFKGEYEILISDNSDEEYGNETPIFEIFKKLSKEKKVRYIRTPKNLQLAKSFEFAYLHARGEFLLSTGADDGLFPWALEQLDMAIIAFPEQKTWSWRQSTYVWPENYNIHKSGLSSLWLNNIKCKKDIKIKSRDVKETFRETAKDFDNYFSLPHIYNMGGISRTLLAEIYEKTDVIWPGNNQDVFMVALLSQIQEEEYFIDNSLIMSGFSDASIGSAVVRVTKTFNDYNKATKALSNRRSQFIGERVYMYVEQFVPSSSIVRGSNKLVWLSAVLTLCSLGIVPKDYLNEIDWKYQYLHILQEISMDDIVYDKYIHMFRYTASKHGEEFLKWFDAELYFPVIDNMETRRGFVDSDRIELAEDEKEYMVVLQGRGKYFATKKENLETVYEAALYAQRYLEGKEEQGELKDLFF